MDLWFSRGGHLTPLTPPPGYGPDYGILSDFADKHAPLTTRNITLRPNAPWWTMELAQAKRTRRNHECIWRQTEKHEDLLKYRELTNQLIEKTKLLFSEQHVCYI